ncbi:hypothetical protein [Actinokineospora iranica]|nr:hypothetical protein [Actinokineospora iranica]
MGDRDRDGILWVRNPSYPGHGKAEFGKVNSLRQRRAMRRLLCQVCGGPADQDDNGVLWVLKDHRGDWPGWPNGMGVTEPPICLTCLRIAVRACPALRKGHAVIRARQYPIVGIAGAHYAPGTPFPQPMAHVVLAFDHPDIPWTLAANLVRELGDCAIVDSSDVAGAD